MCLNLLNQVILSIWVLDLVFQHPVKAVDLMWVCELQVE